MAVATAPACDTDLGHDFYLVSCEKWERYFGKVFARMGWAEAAPFLEDIKDALDGSPRWYWEWCCGFLDDIKNVAMKKVNRKALLLKLGQERADRITREYRKFSSYIASL